MNTTESLAKVNIDGQDHQYNPATHLVEIRNRLSSIKTAQRQKAWVVSQINSYGSGSYISYRATVLRPMYPRELIARKTAQLEAQAKAQAKAAEFASFSEPVKDALTNAVCLRKGKVRVPAAIFKKHTGIDYDGRSPYGPSMGRFLVRYGVPQDRVVEVIRRHVVGLKSW